MVPHVCLSIVGDDHRPIPFTSRSGSSATTDGLQRFQLLVYPDAEDWQWRDLAQNSTITAEVIDLITRIAFADAVSDWQAFESEIPYLWLDDDARSFFSKWSKKLHNRIAAEKEAIICQHLSKFEKLMLALATSSTSA